MNKRERELRELIERECRKKGAALESLDIDGSTHFRAVVRLASGSTVKTCFGFSPGDRRSRLHETARLRRKMNVHE